MVSLMLDLLVKPVWWLSSKLWSSRPYYHTIICSWSSEAAILLILILLLSSIHDSNYSIYLLFTLVLYMAFLSIKTFKLLQLIISSVKKLVYVWIFGIVESVGDAVYLSIIHIYTIHFILFLLAHWILTSAEVLSYYYHVSVGVNC